MSSRAGDFATPYLLKDSRMYTSHLDAAFYCPLVLVVLQHFLRHASGSSSSSSFLQAQLPQPQQQQQQQRQTPVDPATLTACIHAAAHYHELEALCNTFLHNQAFSSKHAAAVISRLHCVSSRRGSSQLLLVELLAAKLRSLASAAAAASCNCQEQQQQQPLQLLDAADAAAVCWGFARVGYQADAALLQHLLQQFWNSYSQQQQQRQQPAGSSRYQALPQLAAGLAGLGFRDPITWVQLRAAAVDVLPEMQPDSLQQLVWALATAQTSDAATTAAIAAAVLDRLDGFEAEQLAQVVWCFYVLGLEGSELFEAAAQQMVVQIEGKQEFVSSSSSAASEATNSTAALHQQQQRLPQQRPALPRQQQQSSSKQQHIVLQLPAHRQHQQQHGRKQQQQSQQHAAAAAAAVQGRLGRTAADLCSAAASQAYSVLEKYDPLLCTLALYRDYLQPAH
jgi:hypothetical protein